ncbi:DUF2508 family protein [Lacticaseibacillus nasuensis]|uniref:DUF2508 family protein n=1 Tax=Lacticaseibacillus nasuensis TaxID=944671 RepID=UPI0006D124A2|nr:DUF2508 family protein [Lacticaseibacillus nasuensis]
MFGKHKAVIKPNADRELLATVARVRESLNRTRELAATFREADPAVTAQISLQGALFDFFCTAKRGCVRSAAIWWQNKRRSINCGKIGSHVGGSLGVCLTRGGSRVQFCLNSSKLKLVR